MIDATKMLERGGFRIKEWLTLRHSKIQQLDQNENQHAVQLSTGVKTSDPETEKVLGMPRNPKEDKLLYTVAVRFGKLQRLISRSQITIVNSTYDPIGVISPFIVRAKITLRKLWALSNNL